MISLTIIAVLLLIRLVVVPYLLRPERVVDPAATEVAPAHADPCLGPMFAPAPRSSDCREFVLCADLLDGRITRERYRSEMAALAARDAEEHPLVLPSDS
ncbi:MAG TPA: hypothetical protein VFO77_11955 [Actinoplanes sp.]|nr:hypothetical protein [Actinoplanes sp.]